VIIRYPSYYAPKAAAMDGIWQQHQKIKLLTVTCSSYEGNSWATASSDTSSLSQVSELSAGELLSCKLTVSGSIIISCSCLLLKSFSWGYSVCLTHDC
jgi:hypothetical protein